MMVLLIIDAHQFINIIITAEMSIKDFNILAKLGIKFITKDRGHTPPSTRSRDSLMEYSTLSRR